MPSCQEIRKELIECILKSKCIERGNSFQECIKAEHAADVPEECQLIRKSFFDCRRGMLDPRQRFRGNKQ
ncbi:uncharacterized protein VTP21DRAFT_10700 [Calcarisporiella thermophila]|uniref:uncharacterized protein n=1 Tax=Calcarisporiella thermophila TaxID=911321 RepID=UPI00374273FF